VTPRQRRDVVMKLVDEAIAQEVTDPTILLDLLRKLRQIVKDDAPYVAYLYETEEESHQRRRYSGWMP
jgi:hypothetical protein